MSRRAALLSLLILAACAQPQRAPDTTAPILWLSVLDRPQPRVVGTDPTAREMDWPTGGTLRLEAWGEDAESGIAGTMLRATQRVTCRGAGGLTVVRETSRERDNSERDRPIRRNAVLGFDLSGDLNRLCDGDRFESGEIVATARAVDGAGNEATTPEFRLRLTPPIPPA